MFIQIKDIAINVDHIESVNFKEQAIIVNMDVYDGAGNPWHYDFMGDEAEAFRNWWEEKAEVYVAL